MRLFLLLSCCLFLFGSVAPEAAFATNDLPVRLGKDYALFFAVDDYSANSTFGNLPDPIKSAELLSAELTEIYGFQTEIVRNPNKDQIYRKLQEYRSRSFGPEDQLLVFISGHGDFNEFETKGYFVPRSGPPIDLPTLGNIVTKIPCEHILLAIDACYSGTIDSRIAFKGRFKRPGVRVDTERDNLIARKLRNKSRLLLTSGGKQRTPSGRDGSPFALGFLNTLRAGYGSGDGLVTYEDLLARMERVTPLPHHGKLTGHEEGSFVFVAKSANAVVDNPSDRNVSPPKREAPVQEATIPVIRNDRPVSMPDNMIFIEGGSFQMGDQFGDEDKDEKPVHKIVLSDFYFGRTEVTMKEFATFVEVTSYVTDAERSGGGYIQVGENYEQREHISWRNDPKGNIRSKKEYDHPVLYVSWNDAILYSNWLSKQHGLTPVYDVSGTATKSNWLANGYRLPTEAEWEYAARSGGKKEEWAGTSLESELKKYANTDGKSDGYNLTAPVGMLKPNGLGLVDMTGNVWEWCWDWYGVSYYEKTTSKNPKGPLTGYSRVLRGGSWVNYRMNSRNSRRLDHRPNSRHCSVGFRLARNSR